jgi:hypothetical protein
MLEAQQTAGLWEKLRAGIPPVPTMEEHAGSLAAIYEELLSQRAGQDLDPEEPEPALAGPAA